MRLTLLRHGQTPSNVAGALDTAPPGPGLTELGRRQASAAAAAVSQAAHVDALFASNQTRARQTAAPLADTLGLAVSVVPNLREISAGDLEMASDPDSVHRYIGTLIAWLDGERDRRIPGGPNGFEFLERYDAAVEAIAAATVQLAGDQGAALAVSHGAAIRAWVAARAVVTADDGAPTSQGPGEAHQHLDNTGAVVIERDGTGPWRVVAWHTRALGGIEPSVADESGPTT